MRLNRALHGGTNMRVVRVRGRGPAFTIFLPFRPLTRGL